MKNEIVCVDLDNTICTQNDDYQRCCPRESAVKALQMLKDNNNTIIIHTDRSIKDMPLTVNWLRIHEIPYDHIQFGKPIAKIYIGYRAFKYQNWNKFIDKLYSGDLGKEYENIIDKYEYALKASFNGMKANGEQKIQLHNAMRSARRVTGEA